MKRLLFILSYFNLLLAARAIEPTIICHGGAGRVNQNRFVGKYKGTVLAAQIGYKILINGGTPLDAVEEAIRSMEVDENFNAGYGSVLTSDGEVEMDACIMDGSNMKVGAVTGAQDIFHAITLARRVMDKTKFNFLGSKGATNLSKAEGFEILQPGMLVTPMARESLEKWKNSSGILPKGEVVGEGGTVGCVAVDSNGNFVAGTSTGGLTGKMPGRIGDTPIVGGGTYADNFLGALSATGTGEVIMKAVLVFDILKTVNITGIDIQSAAQKACDDMQDRYKDDGGVIGMDKNGNIAIGFSSAQMSWAYQKNDDEVHYGINHGDDFVYKIEECKKKDCFN